MLTKEMKDPQPLWKRLLALSGFLLMLGAALAFPRLEDREPLAIGAQIVASLRPSPKPNPTEVAWLFRSYAKVNAAPRQFLMMGPTLREQPLG
jgi:hypothetical protein